MLDPENRILQHLTILYGEERAAAVFAGLRARLPAVGARRPAAEPLSERDAILITYGDQLHQAGQAPLQTLAGFLERHLPDEISGVHLLPFYPYSSDDGFSVIDYRQVDPALGTWEDIATLGQNYRLMFDAVVNHISRQSAWFQGFLQGDPQYRDYFIVAEPAPDLQEVTRPRALPLLTPCETAAGETYVWTTFSADQIDLNYANPTVLLEIVDLLLYYVGRGAEIIRLDAIAYLWKSIGTPCIHLPQTHAVVKLFRAVLDVVAPHVLLITETNVPHEENISYFGQIDPETRQTDEAQMVYQFPLAPLAAHTLTAENAASLRHWAAGLEDLPPFFNFLASHDGIGMLPARGLLAPEALQSLIDRTLAHGGQVSYKNNPDGTASVYELNITLFDLLNDPRQPQGARDVARFLASQVIMLSLAGVPGIYFHSLFGSRNCLGCLAETGRARSLNREKFARAALERELANPHSRAGQVFGGYKRLLQVRRAQPAFHPLAGQEILDLGEQVFGLTRTSRDGRQQVHCLVNVTGEVQTVPRSGLPAKELITGRMYDLTHGLRLEPFQSVWLSS